MTRYLCAHLALIAGLALPVVGSAEEPEVSADQAFFVDDTTPAKGEGDVVPAILDELNDDVELAQFASSIGSNLTLGAASGCTGQWFLGADYLNVRTTYSQATAYILTDLTVPSYTYEPIPFDYSGNYRVYGGYRICECGCEMRFTYTNIDTGGSFVSPPTNTGTGITVTGPFELITAGDGDTISGSASTKIQDYDLGFSRTIPLGSPLCGCVDCCDPCGCWCPAWDITWTGALRFADVESQANFQSNIVATPALNRVAQNNVNFSGAGLRTGMQGRRYFGKKGIASMYLKGDISLLLGEVENTAVGTQFSRHTIRSTQIVPVTELEAGGTVFLTECLSFSGGYLLAAWHDLGYRAEYDFGSTGVQLESWDDANILGVDGWFLRVEATY